MLARTPPLKRSCSEPFRNPRRNAKEPLEVVPYHPQEEKRKGNSSRSVSRERHPASKLSANLPPGLYYAIDAVAVQESESDVVLSAKGGFSVKDQPTRRELLQFALAWIAWGALPLQARTASIATMVGAGTRGMAAEGDAAEAAHINNPYGLIEDAVRSGLFWVDNSTHRVLRVDYK